jgi:hypothetical protein
LENQFDVIQNDGTQESHKHQLLFNFAELVQSFIMLRIKAKQMSSKVENKEQLR